MEVIILYLCSQTPDSLLPLSLHLRCPRAAARPQCVGRTGRWSWLWWLGEQKFCAGPFATWRGGFIRVSHLSWTIYPVITSKLRKLK